MLFLTNINLNKNELQNVVIQNLSADPASPRTGQIYYNTNDKVLKQFNGTTWDVVGKELSPATYSALGGVIVDADTLTVSGTGLLSVKTPTDNNFTNGYKEKIDDIEAGAQVNVIETITVNGTEATPDANKIVAIRVIDSAIFADDSTATAASPIKLTLKSGNTTVADANIPKVSSSSAGVVPKGSSVSTQSQSTKFLREDGTWAAPSYTSVSNYVKKDGTTAMTGDLNMDSHKIIGVTDPTNDQDAATKKYVDDAVAGLPEPMVFKGTLGTGGTITSLPEASSSNEGYVYKVITAGTYQSISAEVGDILVCRLVSGTTYEWVLIPSGDEPSGTVTNIATGNGLTGGPITSSGTISLATAYGDAVNPYGSKTANTVLAAPNGSAGTPSFRALVAADIPDLSDTYQAKGNYKTTQAAVDDPAVAGNASALEFISNITQDTNGVISPTKKKVAIDSTVIQGGTNLVTSGAVYTAIQDVSGGAVKKKTVSNPALTVAGGSFTWLITAASALGTAEVSVDVYNVSTGEKVIPEILVNQSSGAITITINDTNNLSTLAAGTYKAVIIG